MYINNYLALSLGALLALFSPSSSALGASQGADEPVATPTGEARALSSADFAPHFDLDGAYSEAWTYVLLLDGGMQAHFSISRANLGRLLGQVTGAEFAVTGFDGRAYRAPKQYDVEDFEYTASRNRLAVNPRIYVEGAFSDRHHLYFHAGKNGSVFTLDVELTDMAPGLTWGDGVFHLGDDALGVYIHIPQARVSGTITIDGVTKRVSGTAYMDHTFQTDFAPKLVRTAFRLVEHGSQPSVGLFILPADDYEERVVGLGAVERNGRFQLRRPATIDVISARPAHGAEVPRQFVVNYEGGGRTIFNRSRDAQSFATLAEMNAVTRAFAQSYIGGDPVVARGQGTTNAGGAFTYDLLVIH